MNKSTKFAVLDYASQPDKDYDYYGDTVEYKGKKYWVDLSSEHVEFIGNVKEK